MTEYNYCLYKPARNGFYRPQNCGYTDNPAMAGLYTEEYALNYIKGLHGEVKAYSVKSRFVKQRLKAYEQNKIRYILCALECVTPDQRARLIAIALEKKMADDAINYPQREYIAEAGEKA